ETGPFGRSGTSPNDFYNLSQHVINVTDAQKNAKTHELTAGELMDFFQTSIKHCWNWATKYPSSTPHLSPMFRPFSGIRSQSGTIVSRRLRMRKSSARSEPKSQSTVS